MGQDHRRIETAFNALETILDIRTLEGKISVTKTKDFDLFLGDILKEGGRTIPRLGLALAGGAEDDPSHDEIWDLGSETQNCSAAADLDIIGMGTQAK
jgi:hypothetical protein